MAHAMSRAPQSQDRAAPGGRGDFRIRRNAIPHPACQSHGGGVDTETVPTGGACASGRQRVEAEASTTSRHSGLASSAPSRLTSVGSGMPHRRRSPVSCEVIAENFHSGSLDRQSIGQPCAPNCSHRGTHAVGQLSGRRRAAELAARGTGRIARAGTRPAVVGRCKAEIVRQGTESGPGPPIGRK